MIDNAGDVEQVRPLLPGSLSCVAVLTSRDALAGLVARDGGRRLDLGRLPPTEASRSVQPAQRPGTRRSASLMPERLGRSRGPRAMGGDLRLACDVPTACWEARQ